jgi:hypothetical protein
VLSCNRSSGSTTQSEQQTDRGLHSAGHPVQHWAGWRPGQWALSGPLKESVAASKAVNLDQVLLRDVVGHEERGNILALVSLELNDLPVKHAQVK